MRAACLHIIKGKFYTNIESCRRGYYHGNAIWVVTFSGNKHITRNYNLNDVYEYPYIDSKQGDFRIQDSRGGYHIVDTVHRYGKNARKADYYGIESSGGYVEYVPCKDANIEYSVRYQDNPILEYLVRISGLSTIADETEDRTISLYQKYDRAKFIFSGNLLSKYIRPDKAAKVTHKNNAKSSFLVFPFGCNAAQWEAVNNAVTDTISIIQGPPGTGKTQTILNIIANLVLQGKSVQVVSNNNSAVTNVLEKLKKDGYAFFAAMLGRSQNKDAFIAGQTGEYPDINSWDRNSAQLRHLHQNIEAISTKLRRYFTTIEEKAVLTGSIDEFRHQLELRRPGFIANIPVHRTASSRLFRLIIILDENLRHGRSKPTIRIRINALLCRFGFRVPDRTTVENLALRRQLFEMETQLAETNEWINEFEPKYKTFVADSQEYFKAMLYHRYEKGNSRQRFTVEDLWKTQQAQAFLKEYPVVLSTTFSATTNLSQVVPFDVLIMDEASQIDIATGALALNCARRVVVVGDDKQLPNVIPDAQRQEADKFFISMPIPAAYKFTNNSFLSSIQKVFSQARVTLLREHYRCEPRIIGFCNERFYGGKLIPMTRRDSAPSMTVIRTVIGNHARGRSNQRQAEETVREVMRLRSSYSDIGIIVPYNDQAKLIRKLLPAELQDIPVSTVHKFQGREKDAIILCTVDNTIREFVDDPHLLNVAVSRAKKHFSLIVNGEEQAESNIKALMEYIATCNGEIFHGNIRSVFDALYGQYKEERKRFLSEHNNISQYVSEDLMVSLLDDITSSHDGQQYGWLFQYPLYNLISENTELTEEEKVYASRSWTLVDFLLYDRTTKRPKLVIEVDGTSFHQFGSKQWERDQLKDSILFKCGIHLLRLSTDGSNEREKILEYLQ